MNGNNTSLSKIFLTLIILINFVSLIVFFDLHFVFGDGVVDTITVGEAPHHITYNPDNHNMYVANHHAGTISVIDSSTNTVVDTITVGFRPFGIAYNPDNGHMYVATTGSGTIYVIDPSTNRVVDTESVGDSPLAIAYNANNGHMYVTNFNPGTVLVIDSSTNMVVDTVKVGDGPWAIAYNPHNGNIYAVNQQSSDVSVIDSATNSVIDTIDVENGPFGIAYNPDNHNMYVTNYESDSVSVIDSATNSVIDTIDVENGPFGIAYNYDNGNMYVANSFSGTASIIDSSTNSVMDIIVLENGIWGVEHNPEKGDIYITSTQSDTVFVIGKIPIAEAGPDQTVRSSDLVQLDGSNSSDPNGSPLSYSWTQIAGPIVELNNPSSQKPSFTAPETEEQQSLIFQLTVTNDEGIESMPDNVTVTVNPLTSPLADAGQDQSVQSDDTVQLDGTGSSANGGSPIVEYQWMQTEGPPVTMDNPNSATPSFTAPDTYNLVNLVFELIVTNEDELESEPDSVTITVNPIIQPIADAGANQTVDSMNIVQLDGTASSANGGSPIVIYQWIQTQGPTVTLDDPTSATPSFIAPETLVEENIVFELVVTNEDGVESEPDSVTIFIEPVLLPIADAGFDQEVNSNQLVQLDGSNSLDPNGSSLTYFWNQILGPDVSLSEQSSSNPSFTAPEVNEQTDLTFQLTVTNEQGLTSEPDQVTITVNPISTPPPEPPRTIGDLIMGIIQNPLNVTNSIDSANEIRDILTDNNPDNDQVVCDLIDSENKHTSDIRDILNC